MITRIAVFHARLPMRILTYKICILYTIYRIDYLSRYLGQLERAILAGVDVRGYFVWSLLDNFE